ncbi:MAG TPA: hypothetical protein VEL82_02250 [Thermoplasmata archaeon]|nr:hypothetical protein [Thermoplasmata archaeon]
MSSRLPSPAVLAIVVAAAAPLLVARVAGGWPGALVAAVLSLALSAGWLFAGRRSGSTTLPWGPVGVIVAGDAALALLLAISGTALDALFFAPLFVATLALEILLLAVLSASALAPGLRFLLAAQAGVVAATPTLVDRPEWGLVSALLGATVIVASLVVALQFLYRHKQLEASVLGGIVRWPFAALVSAAGWFLWQFEGSPYVLGASLLLQLAVAIVTVLEAARPPAGERVPWLLRPTAIFEFLLFAFLGEFFLGALLDLEIAGRTFLQYIPFVAYTGSALHQVGIAAYNGLWFGSAILASAWFLVLLGFTMGPLVVLKIREAHERSQKYRLGLTIAAYALAAIYIPSLASSTPLLSASWLASLPVIGWGFGLRTGGPFESGLFLAVILMYVSVGVLTVLFGRKAVCSVMCGAALMYQGTAMSEMRGFNQSSKVGQYFLGSRLSTGYVVASGVALASLFAISVLAFLKLLPAVQVANGEFDTAALPLPVELYFGGVWFAMFVTTPFIGTYNCATTGFCHWGALTLPFARIGLFRLKVKDKKVCQQCTTFDCAKACPVGLVDMPLYFRRDGEYRSTKCCGVGDCVGACPYGNMYHQDVRFWLRRWWVGRRGPSSDRPIDRGVPLPMVASAPPTARAPATARTAGAGPDTAPPVRA